MVKRVNRKGFTMVELLATIVILGILSVIAISSVSRLISKSKEAQDKQLKNTLLMAAKSYLETNSSKFPKEIGQGRRIFASELKAKKYLKGDFKNSKGQTCDRADQSYVLVRKVSKTKYTYEAYIYCGDEEADDIENVAKPIINISFNGQKINENGKGIVISDLANAQLKIIIEANRIDEEDENSSIVLLDGYSFSIAAVTKEKENEESDGSEKVEEQEREVYNSGSVSVRNKKNITITKPLTDYLDISKVTKITVKVVARNVDGGYRSVSRSVGANENNPNPTVEFVDNDPPTCNYDKIVGQASFDDNWVTAVSEVTEKKVTIGCDDKNGSGCIRDTFTKTWPNEETFSGEYGYITIEDNAGNKSDCPVLIKMDLTYPTINIEAYQKDQTGAPIGGSVFTDDVARTVGGNSKLEEARATVQKNQYKNLSNNWMNQKNYSSGIVYKVKLTEESNLIKWNWDTGRGDSQSGILGEDDLVQDEKTKRYSNKNDLYLTFNEGGVRTGTLTVTDKAGNVSQIVINAQVDVTPPTCQVKLSKDTPDGKNGWYKSSLNVNLVDVNESGSGLAGKGLSTSSKVTYNGKDSTIQNDTKGVTYYGYVKDNAGNETKCQTSKIKVDTKAPNIDSVDLSGVSGENGWYKNDVTATLKATESGSGVDNWRYADTPQLAGNAHLEFNGSIWPNEVGTNFYGVFDLGRNLEAFRLFVMNHTSTEGSIKYCVNEICDKSDDKWLSEGSLAGETGVNYKITQVGFKFTGKLANYFNLKYYIHRKFEKSSDWLQNGQISKNIDPGNPHYVECLQFQIEPKDSNNILWKETTTTKTSFNHIFTTEQNLNNYFQVCDKAGNCSPVKTVPIKIDKTNPIVIGKNYQIQVNDKIYEFDTPENVKPYNFWDYKEVVNNFKGWNDVELNGTRNVPGIDDPIKHIVKWQTLDNMSGVIDLTQRYPACPISSCHSPGHAENDNSCTLGQCCIQNYHDSVGSIQRFHETFGNYGHYVLTIKDTSGNQHVSSRDIPKVAKDSNGRDVDTSTSCRNS